MYGDGVHLEPLYKADNSYFDPLKSFKVKFSLMINSILIKVFQGLIPVCTVNLTINIFMLWK